jgi:hypothetical protein
MQFSLILSPQPSVQTFSSAPGSQTTSFYVGFEVLTAVINIAISWDRGQDILLLFVLEFECY